MPRGLVTRLVAIRWSSPPVTGHPGAGFLHHPGERTRGAARKVVVCAKVEGRIGIVCAPLVRT
eukprot:4724945-Pyramimonas_sp.AAC.1